jgi:pyruvate/2-oxoglutarate dehydrogenase complex dihydrolipoamide dehydrogenase (E3) component/uncharacterized membrane protein YdjX (TVP38/TMEM64 family)
VSSTAETTAPPKAPTSRGKLAVYAVLGLAALAALLLAGRQAGASVPRFAAWVESLGVWGPVVFILGYAVATVAFIPGSLLTLAAGAIFGLAKGTLYTFLGATLGAAAAFLVARHLARGAIEKKIAGNPRFGAIDRAVGREGFKIVALLRLSPVFPFNLLNYSLGLTKVRFLHYLAASVAMLPGTLLYVYYGKAAGSLAALASGAEARKGAESWIFLGVGLLATIAVTTYVTRLAGRALKSELDAPSAPRRTAMSEPALAPSPPLIEPLDEHNRKLVENVHPPAWVNPEPAPRYHLVVIGAGTAGLVSAAGAAGLGARVALIERHLMGGDCLNVGCVPSKGVIRAARAWQEAREARARFGGPAVVDGSGDFAAAMERMRRLRAGISGNDSARRFQGLGVDVFLGDGRFISPDAVEVGGRRLRFRRAVVATGGRAAELPIPGLAEAGYRTNETIFNLTELPKRLAVIGGGPIGCEMAQSFARFGSRVTVIDIAPHVLPREDGDAAEVVQKAMAKDGVRFELAAKILEVLCRDGEKVVVLEREGQRREATVDEILVSVGRAPNVEGLGLDAAGVRFGKAGIEVDDHLRTSNRNIYACGDVASRFQFTHLADAQARIVIQNALFFGRAKASALTIPWCTYTTPEIAHVGMYEGDARDRGIEVDTLTVHLADVDRALLDGADEGFLRLHVAKGSKDGRILGATLVAEHAGDMFGELCLAVTRGIGLNRIASVIHPYPTQGEVVKKAADQWRRGKLTPGVKKLFERWFRVFR